MTTTGRHHTSLLLRAGFRDGYRTALTNVEHAVTELFNAPELRTPVMQQRVMGFLKFLHNESKREDFQGTAYMQFESDLRGVPVINASPDMKFAPAASNVTGTPAATPAATDTPTPSFKIVAVCGEFQQNVEFNRCALVVFSNDCLYELQRKADAPAEIGRALTADVIKDYKRRRAFTEVYCEHRAKRSTEAWLITNHYLAMESMRLCNMFHVRYDAIHNYAGSILFVEVGEAADRTRLQLASNALAAARGARDPETARHLEWRAACLSDQF